MLRSGDANVSTSMKAKRRSTTPSNSAMKGDTRAGARPKTTSTKRGRSTGAPSKNLNQTMSKLMHSAELQKFQPKEERKDSPTSYRMKNSYMIKNHGSSGFD